MDEKVTDARRKVLSEMRSENDAVLNQSRLSMSAAMAKPQQRKGKEKEKEINPSPLDLSDPAPSKKGMKRARDEIHSVRPSPSIVRVAIAS